MVKVIDCFTFYNELEMLDFKLRELEDVVDYFVIVEATTTYSGNNKPLYFQMNKHRYNKYINKIIHIVVDDLPNNNNAWDNEFYQRTCIHRGIEKIPKLADSDIIIIEDCDEIPDSKQLNIIKHMDIHEPFSLEMDMYYYNLTCRGGKWYHSKILPYSIYKTINDPQKIRFINNCRYISQCGWHFSYFGNPQFIVNKLKNFSHQEYNKPQYLDEKTIQQQIDNCSDLFFRTEQHCSFTKIAVEDNKYLPVHHTMLL